MEVLIKSFLSVKKRFMNEQHHLHTLQPPLPSISSFPDPETAVVDHHNRDQQPQPEPLLIIPTLGVSDAYVDWPGKVIGFCFSWAVGIALQTLQTGIAHPLTFHLLCLSMVVAVASLFVSSYISLKFPKLAQVAEHVGVLFGFTSFFFAITASIPLSLKLASWTIYALSLLTISLCNLL